MLVITVHGHKAGPRKCTMITVSRRLTSLMEERTTAQSTEPGQPPPAPSGTNHKDTPPRLLSLDQVMDRVALKRTSIYQLIKCKAFPYPVKIQRASRWVESEVSDWIRAQMSKR